MVQGLIIEDDMNKAENIKILLENTDRRMEIRADIATETDKNYLLKDIREYDFVMSKVKSINEDELRKEILPYLKVVSVKKKKCKRLCLKDRVFYIDVNDVIGLEVMGKECCVHTRTGYYEIGRISLGKLIEFLDDPHIVRCHKSFAINLKFIRGFIRDTRYRWLPVFIVTTTLEARMTISYLDEVIDRYDEIYRVDKMEYFDLNEN